MEKKQYNNVIDYTLKHEQAAQSDDSLATARAISDNMGVALPQGDMKTVYETIKSDDYMGWKSCTMQEAQEAADKGSAAIGISEDRIVVLSANDEEQPVAQTASVMTLNENTPAYAVDGLQYYVYRSGTTNYRVFSSNHLINQASTSIVYPTGQQPGTEARAFWDPLFYRTVCGKSGATGTIKASGCGICCLAMYALYKSGQSNTNNNTYYSVKAATQQSTNHTADMYNNSILVSYGGATVNVSAVSNATSTKIEQALNNGSMCIVRIKTYHYVLVYGVDYTKSGTDRYLVADPNGGQFRSLTKAMEWYGLNNTMSNISTMRTIN